MPFAAPPPRISKQQRAQLKALVRRQNAPAAEVVRARIILGLAEGATYQALCVSLKTSSATIALWRRRWAAAGMSGLISHHVGSEPRVLRRNQSSCGLGARDRVRLFLVKSRIPARARWATPTLIPL